MSKSLEARLSELDLPVPAGLVDEALGRARAARPARVSRRPRRRLVVSVAVTAILVVAALLGGTLALRDGDHTASAEEILGKASRAGGTFSYHEIRRSENSGLPGGWEIQETWYQDAAHQRNENHEGDGSSAGAVVDGKDVWWWAASSDGAVKAIHSGPGGPISVGSTGTTGEGLLVQYGGPESCRIAALQGETELLGRTAYIIRVVPAPQTCSRTDDTATYAQQAAARGDSDTYWIDSATYLPLKSEHRQGSTVTATTTVTVLETDVSFRDSTFTYAATPGTVIREVRDRADLCTYWFTYCPNNTPPAQSKSP